MDRAPEATCLILALLGSALGCGADTRPATWAYIAPVILEPSCATVSCHGRAAAVAGLDFSDPDRAYTSLMGLKVWIVDPTGTDGCKPVDGVVVCQKNFRPMVTPYNPEQSRLVNMLRGRNAARMPPDRPLPEADIELIEKWIRSGAPRRELGLDGPRPDAGDGGPSVTVTVTLPDGAIYKLDAGDGGTGDGGIGDAEAGAEAGADGASPDGGAGQ
jgi:hypothetical protein